MIRFAALLTALLAICIALPLMAQPDSSKMVPVKFAGFACLANDWDNSCWYNGPPILDGDSIFEASIRDCGLACKSPNFDTHLLLVQHYGGDCHLRIMPYVWWNESKGILTLRAYNIWGGCRAGGQKQIALLVEKPAVSYTVVFEEIQVDSWEEYEEARKQKVEEN